MYLGTRGCYEPNRLLEVTVTVVSSLSMVKQIFQPVGLLLIHMNENGLSKHFDFALHWSHECGAHSHRQLQHLDLYCHVGSGRYINFVTDHLES